MLCPCCSGKEFSVCCEPIINKVVKPVDPEQLMRSRFTAFVLKNAEYLYETSSERLKVSLTKASLLESAQMCRFIALSILDSNEKEVEFIAKILINNTYSPLHERSSFIKDDNGNWYYDEGTLFDTEEVDLKRNDPCPCGSGKKFKKCHML